MGPFTPRKGWGDLEAQVAVPSKLTVSNPLLISELLVNGESQGWKGWKNVSSRNSPNRGLPWMPLAPLLPSRCVDAGSPSLRFTHQNTEKTQLNPPFLNQPGKWTTLNARVQVTSLP